MTIENISLFQALNANMRYQSQRQKVISQNVANADTPSYTAKDLGKVDFSKMLSNVSKSGTTSVTMNTTRAGHIDPIGTPPNVKEAKNKSPYEVNPSGNGVDLEEQMIKSNEVQMNYNLMLNLYRSNLDMIRTSLGKNK